MPAKQKILSFILLLSFGASSYAAVSTEKKQDRYFGISRNLDVFNTLFRELDLFYVDTIQSQELIRSAIDKMLLGLDPYTTYIPESELGDLKYMATGEYGGIGSIIAQRGDGVLIVEPYENMPAQKAGLLAGDYLVEIDGQKTKGKTSLDVSAMLKGSPGEIVTVVVERPGEKKQIKKEIAREKIILNPVDYYDVRDGIAYIRLSGFTDKASMELKKALVDLKSKNELSGLVLDLRGNPGGIIDEAVNISNFFIPKGKEVLATRGKNKQWDNVYKTLREPIDVEIPMVVLVDGESASASEIIAGAMQDLDRAVIIGNKTYGKGLVQTTRPVGYEDYLKVTTAKYYTPSGRCIQAIDYEHKNKDGHAPKIADSLTHEFKTARGRIVKDGGGIVPDIILKEPETLDISYRLITDYLIFDYATEYYQKHPQIMPAGDFVFTDSDFEDFKQYLKSKNFTYQLRSTAILDNLREIARIEGYSDIAKEEFDALANKLKPDTDKDLELMKTSIVELLSMEIVKRYYYQQGEIIQALKNDEGLAKAIEVLKNKEEYDKILNIKN